MAKIRTDAVLLHGDKWGKVIRKLRIRDNGVHENNGVLYSNVPIIQFDSEAAPKIDMRSKAGRALKAQQKAQSIQ